MAIGEIGKAPAVTSQPASTNTSAMAVVTTLFFMWGFLTCLNDILIRTCSRSSASTMRR